MTWAPWVSWGLSYGHLGGEGGQPHKTGALMKLAAVARLLGGGPITGQDRM